ncbi:MAG TPA: M28 family peptidase [Chthoniobacterales bacterium]
MRAASLLLALSEVRNRHASLRFGSPLLLAALLLATSCKKAPPLADLPQKAASATPADPAPAPSAPTPTPLSPKAASISAVTDRIDGKIALQRARTICTLGSRAYGTPGYRQTLAYLRSELTRLGWHTVFQAFESKTPAGDRTYTNLIATWPLDKDAPKGKAATNRLILTAHYDAPNAELTDFPAASSGAAGCGLILELAERLATAPTLAARVEFVIFDGEEPVQQMSATDGLAGSRFYLHSLNTNGETSRVRALLAFGAIGHSRARWTLPTVTNADLNRALQTSIFLHKWEGQLTLLGRPAWGPHLPALQAGIPATFLHDALFPALGTADDTPEQLEAESLRRAGLASLQLLNLPPLAPAAETKTN